MKISTILKILAVPMYAMCSPFLVYLGSAVLLDEIIKEKEKLDELGK